MAAPATKARNLLFFGCAFVSRGSMSTQGITMKNVTEIRMTDCMFYSDEMKKHVFHEVLLHSKVRVKTRIEENST